MIKAFAQSSGGGSGTAWKRTAIFTPKITIDLRPDMAMLVGRVLEWDYAGTGDHDDPYPGQTRWMPARKHDPDLGRSAAYWVPEEDLADVPAPSQT